MWSAFFCTVNISGDIKNFVQIAILLNKTKMVDISAKFFISWLTFKAQKRQTTFWKCQNQGYFVICISRILLLKLGWQINVANYIKKQRRHSSRLPTVMFRGTPCTYLHTYSYLFTFLLTYLLTFLSTILPFTTYLHLHSHLPTFLPTFLPNYLSPDLLDFLPFIT